MATAREFFVLVRLREETGMELHTHLSRVQKSLEDQGFKASLASGEDLKRMLGVYFEQNATTEKYEDYDGEDVYKRQLWDISDWMSGPARSTTTRTERIWTASCGTVESGAWAIGSAGSVPLWRIP